MKYKREVNEWYGATWISGLSSPFPLKLDAQNCCPLQWYWVIPSGHWKVGVGWKVAWVLITHLSVFLSIFFLLFFQGFLCVAMSVVDRAHSVAHGADNSQPRDRWEHRLESSFVDKNWDFVICLFLSIWDPYQIVAEASSGITVWCSALVTFLCYVVFCFACVFFSCFCRHIFLSFVLDTVFLCVAWETHFVEHSGLKVTDPLASASWLLALKTCTATTLLHWNT